MGSRMKACGLWWASPLTMWRLLMLSVDDQAGLAACVWVSSCSIADDLSHLAGHLADFESRGRLWVLWSQTVLEVY